MSTEFPTADIHTMTGAYVLHALSDDERAAFERHLTQCPACAQEVAELAETAVRLGAVAATAPPPSLKSRVMADIAQTRQLPPNGAAPGEVHVLRPRRWPVWISVTAAAASVLFAVVIAIGSARTNQRLTDELAQLRSANAEVGQLLAAPDAEIGTARADTGGSGVLVVSRTQDKAVFLADGLPALPADRTYQLWLVEPAQTRSGGLLRPADGPLVARDVGDVEAVAITVEPAGGSPSGTTPPILQLELPG